MIKKQTIILLFALAGISTTDAQVLRLLAKTTKHYTYPPGPSSTASDSMNYYYSENKGRSQINKNFIYDSMLHLYDSNLYSKYYYTYDLNDNLLTETSIEYDSTKNVNAYAYNSKNQVTHYSQLKTGKSPNNMFTNISYIYDSSGNLISMLTRYGFTGFEPGRIIYTYSYNHENKLQTELHQNWDSIQNIIHNTGLNLLFYDSLNRHSASVYRKWNATLSIWYDYWLQRHTYENSDLVLREQLQIAGGDTVLKGRSEFHYTPKGLLTKSADFHFGELDTLVIVDSMVYDDFGLIQFSCQTTFSSSGTGFRDTYYYYNNDTGETAISLRLYPNPATSYFIIENNWETSQNFRVTIFDISGRLIRHWSESNITRYKKIVPTGDLAPGIYTIRLSGDVNTVQRLIIAK